MKFLHLSDLHIGKRVNEFSMADDQKYILKKIINIAMEEKPDAVLIAGDVYDKSVPSAEAVEIFDDFLVELAKGGFQVFIISGNHDSAERLAFGNRIMDASGIHIASVYNGKIEPVTLEDEYGPVNIYMLPFIKPANVRAAFPDDEIGTWTDALTKAVEQMNVDKTQRNILIAHQFVTGAERSESEETPIGGLDNVDASAFSDFDYVALGHIHGPQNIGSERIRYCGTPLKYSFSEAKHKKSVTVVEIGAKKDECIREDEKNPQCKSLEENTSCEEINSESQKNKAEKYAKLSIKTVPLEPLHDMVEIKGTYDEVANRSFYENKTWDKDYMHITLTDEEDVPNALGKLRVIYRNLMKLDYDNKRTRTNQVIEGASDAETKTPIELFAELFEMQNNAPMTEEQEAFVQKLIEEIWEENA